MDTLLTARLAGAFGGHAFKDIDTVEWPVCIHCFASISTFELKEGLWPARLGRYCPAVLFELDGSHTPKEK